jgi:hypothetical protein
MSNRVIIRVFRSYKGKKRYEVRTPLHFLGGGFASRKSAEKYRNWVLKHKEQLGIKKGKLQKGLI